MQDTAAWMVLLLVLPTVASAGVRSIVTAQERAVALPPGITPLGDIGVYRVVYQSYGEQEVEMPPSWVGHFETVSGVSYLPGENLLDRDAILLHCPWRVPTGLTRVDYRLLLPAIRPITLSFGIAMRPDMVAPDRSDGVTFSVYLLYDGQTQQLMCEHYARGEWRDFRFDLSPHAGREVVLRLQVEPGPANSPSFDYSYFGDAQIIAGSPEGGRYALLQRLTSSKAYLATRAADLRAVANNPETIVPGNLLPYENGLEQAGGSYRFLYRGADAEIIYTYTPQTGTLDDFQVQVDGGPPFRPAAGGGVTMVGEGGRLIPARGGRPASLSIEPERAVLDVLWEYQLEGQPVQIAWIFGIAGKALTVRADCQAPVVGGFSLGRVGDAPLRRSFSIPYLPADWNPGQVAYLPAQNVFVCRYLDWTQSHSSRCPQGESTYDPKTDGTRNPLHESGYIAISPSVHEVLPNAPHAPSRFLELLGPRLMLDIWGHHKGTYQGDAENLRALKDHGVDHLAIISHVWQRYGYDVKLPDHLPANPDFGGDQGMIEFGRAANECGYIWSLHENYIDLYPDAPSYDPSARVLLADGTPSPAWFNAGTGVQSFGLKCNRALGYAQQNSPEIHRRFGTTAAYLDVHTCVPPWHQLDHEAGQPMAAMALAKVRFDSELFRFMQETHEGPLFGEGANHFYWAGKVDGVEAQVAGGEHHEPFPDFDLLKLHPQMVNHGMGYYERWFERGYNHRWGWDTGTLEQIDKYRAQELAYGHAGFIGAAQVNNLQWVAKEHHLMHPVQRLYGAARPTEIAYLVDGEWVTGSVALVLGERRRQRITYDSGLTLWVNWSAEPWEVEGRLLPQWGFLARGPETEVFTELRDGRFCDYAECPEFLFADARTAFTMPYLDPGKDIEPRLRNFEDLGEGKIRLTYEWIVNDTLDQDYHCFVHFVHPQGPGGEGIVFQQDHALPTPTSRWRKGEVVVDGPYEITVPGDRFDAYDLVIGLYKGERVLLKGMPAGSSRVLIGRLELTREGGRVTAVKLGDLSHAVVRERAPRADFRVRLNPTGTLIDFGKVATDGSVKVARPANERTGEPSVVVFPYPREQEFRVGLDLGAIVPGAEINPGRVTVRALAAGTQADLGLVEHTWREGRVWFSVGRPGAGRYVVEW